MEVIRTVSPVDGRVLVERPLAGASEVDRALATAAQAAAEWARVPLDQRIAAVQGFVDAFVAKGPVLAEEITWQMGRPLAYAPGEIRGFEDRARTMIRLAPQVLADQVQPQREGFTRFIRREPLGVVLVLAPWNYPYLTAVNTIVPALLAGNVVLIKHSDQTPLCAERLSEAATAAGLPEGVLQHIHMSHPMTAAVVADPRVAFVAFTGSVGGGQAVHAAAGGHLKGVGLELGGKDPAYVRPDADFDFAVDNLVDGAFFNSGQSCCGIERIYVHERLYPRFIEAYAAKVREYKLGNPLQDGTTLGPVVRRSNAAMIRAQVSQAIQRGATGLVSAADFDLDDGLGPYLAPQVLVDVTHDMDVMTEETFGPVVGIMRVKDDAEAVRRMNHSQFGLTASIWTTDEQVALQLGAALETGTVFMNRCDYLDPELAWVGVKLSGRGATLSTMGFEQLTRPKSFHLRSRT